MSPFFAAARAIVADLRSCLITRVTPLFAFLSLSVLSTCLSRRSAWSIRRFRTAGSCSLPQSGPAEASAMAAQTSPQVDVQGPLESTRGPSSTQPLPAWPCAKLMLVISKSLKKSESASATRSMLPFCVETMATGPVQGVMPPPVDRCMVTPKINEAGVLVPLKYVSVPNGKTWPETTSLGGWPVNVRALGGVPPLLSPQVTLDVSMPETTAVLVLSLETGRRVRGWRKSPDSTGLSKKPVMVPE